LEYDIRETHEDLYLSVLACRLGQNAGASDDSGGAAALL
jgi:hypothetical protein